MNILLVNDDGYDALGIKVLNALLKKYGRVVTIAPKTMMSAKSVSLILSHPVKVEKLAEDLYAMEATPADCVAYGLSSLGIKFDLVVSGINHGLNISYDTMYSGTVGACLQALTYRVPAIALSCDNNFEIVEKYFDKTYNFILKNKLLSIEYLLNINYPLGEQVDEIKLTHIFYRKEVTYYQDMGDNYYQAKRELNDSLCDDKDSDVYAVNHHIVSITKLYRSLDHE